MSDVAMPESMRQWMRMANWGNHHLQWHLERIWYLLDPAARDWAATQGWSPAPRQEGTPGNGLEFLAMHRAMILLLKESFPEHAELLRGWNSLPMNPDDPEDPVPTGANREFNANMRDAVARLQMDLASFANDDELGTFIETSLRPTDSDPAHRSPDASTGIHNYVHGRFQDDSSPLNMGDPTVNIENRRFWKLHGWIDERWTEFRKVKGLSESDPTYQQALGEGYKHMRPAGPHDALTFSLKDGHGHEGHGGHGHHPPHPIHIPPQIKQLLLKAFYWCDLD